MAFVDGQVGYPDADTQAFIEVLHESGQHYRAAILAGGGDIDPYPLSAKEGWWIARHAARYAAGELLKEAVKVGLHAGTGGGVAGEGGRSGRRLMPPFVNGGISRATGVTVAFLFDGQSACT